MIALEINNYVSRFELLLSIFAEQLLNVIMKQSFNSSKFAQISSKKKYLNLF